AVCRFLFGSVGLSAAALVVVAIVRGQPWLLLGAALATAVTMPVWALGSLARADLWGPTLSVIGLTVLLNLPARLARRLMPRALEEFRFEIEASGLIVWSGLIAYGLIF